MIKIITVGKLKEKAMMQLVDEYVKRLQSFTKVQLIEVADEKIPKENSQLDNENAKKKEGERILSKIKKEDYVILLDLHGTMLTSEGLAKKINDIQTYQSSQICFVIAGSLGFSKEVLALANYRWKLSDLTFPHQMVKVILIEQIYRAFTILNHICYHK